MTKFTPALLVLATAGLFAANSHALTKDEYQAEKTRIGTTYKEAIAKCDPLKANAKDICREEAKGADKVSRAELEAQYKPSEATQLKARLAKVDADYEVAKEKCDDQTGDARNTCRKDARTTYTTAKESARMTRTAAPATPAPATTPPAGSMSTKPATTPPAGGMSTNPASAPPAAKDAAADKSQADYKAAVERCGPMAGAAKEKCLADAKQKAGQN